ncbi:type II toxin-antitoxin system RelE/ParE family toxin [Nocardia sp. NPDC127579]|uniref:type II toxin-antitoxin system RelE/ParE family toxin n=1 Tax=Nocardia sp. NPDC127579 TaxID=3345402 RepID=UPI00362780F0
MSDYALSPAARADLRRIWDYTAERWSEDQAEQYLHALRHTIERAAANPRIGRPLDDIRSGYLKLTAGSHVVFYRITGAGIVHVIRVLHQRMDPGRHL